MAHTNNPSGGGLSAEEARGIAQNVLNDSDAAKDAHTHNNKSVLDQSTAAYTSAEKTKLGHLEDRFKGIFATPEARDIAITSPENGDYCTIQSTSTVWFYSDGWIDSDSNSVGDMLAGTYDPQSIASDSFNRSNHTGTQAISTVAGLSSELSGKGDMFESTYDPNSIESDAFARSNHTGLQAMSTVSGLATELSQKGDMFKNIYDPSDISANVFDRGNQTGTQSISTISGLQEELNDLDSRVSNAEGFISSAPTGSDWLESVPININLNYHERYTISFDANGLSSSPWNTSPIFLGLQDVTRIQYSIILVTFGNTVTTRRSGTNVSQVPLCDDQGGIQEIDMILDIVRNGRGRTVINFQGSTRQRMTDETKNCWVRGGAVVYMSDDPSGIISSVNLLNLPPRYRIKYVKEYQ